MVINYYLVYAKYDRKCHIFKEKVQNDIQNIADEFQKDNSTWVHNFELEHLSWWCRKLIVATGDLLLQQSEWQASLQVWWRVRQTHRYHLTPPDIQHIFRNLSNKLVKQHKATLHHTQQPRRGRPYITFATMMQTSYKGDE